MAALLRRFLLDVVPGSAAELKRHKRAAAQISDPQLRREACASISLKDFHVHGGCILATFLPQRAAGEYVRLVAAFETAVDYLDNLCDRTGQRHEEDLRALHEALEDAVRPGARLRDYFRYREATDGGYLTSLVRQAQGSFAALPGYGLIAPYLEEVTRRYCNLQALKHLPAGQRERRCQAEFGQVAPALRWFEGAAACGSTMPTFALAFGALSDCDAPRVRELFEGYFPFIAAFHILLDYFIDQAEDVQHDELNFVACYGDAAEANEGIVRIAREAMDRARGIKDAAHHVFALRAMCGFYCTRPKVFHQGLEDRAAAIAESVDVDIASRSWRLADQTAFGPLLALYRRVTRT